MQVETSRLLIREFAADDFNAVHGYASDAEVTRHMIWGPNTEEETRSFLNNMIEVQERQPRLDYEFAVVLKASGELIGGCGIHVSDPKQAEVGYCFHPQYWGQGYATEAAEAMLAFGFGELGLHRIFAKCRPDNKGSARVMQRIGMSYEGHLRGHMRHKGAWHDSYQYSILEQEYAERHKL